MVQIKCSQACLQRWFLESVLLKARNDRSIKQRSIKLLQLMYEFSHTSSRLAGKCMSFSTNTDTLTQTRSIATMQGIY